MCRMKAVPPSWIPWWAGISMACREDTALNNPLQNGFIRYMFWMHHLNGSEWLSPFFWQLVRAILQFSQACESACSVGPVYCFCISELQEGSSMGIWIAGRLDLFKPEAVLYVGIILVQMLKRWFQMFHVTSSMFGLIQWCVLEQDFWRGVAGKDI